MTLNWVQVLAQVLNFLLLVWLLRRFLFEPITAILAKREERIKAGLREGAIMQERAQAAESQYRRLLMELESGRENAMREALEAAAKARDSLIESARKEAEIAHKNFHAALLRERRDAEDTVSRQIISSACEIAAQVLSKVSGASLADQAVYVLIGRMADASTEQVSLLRSALARERHAVVATHAPLGEGAIRSLTETIAALAGTQDVQLDFYVDPDLLCGVRISTAGATLAWNALDEIGQVEALASIDLSSAGGARSDS